MNRAERRQTRMAIMQKNIYHLRWAYGKAIDNALAAGVDVTSDKAVDKAYDRMHYVADKLAKANYTETRAAEDAKKWKQVDEAMADAGLKFGKAWWNVHSTFHSARFWRIQSYYNTLVR